MAEVILIAFLILAIAGTSWVSCYKLFNIMMSKITVIRTNEDKQFKQVEDLQLIQEFDPEKENRRNTYMPEPAF
jgi:hypothetical protein